MIVSPKNNTVANHLIEYLRVCLEKQELEVSIHKKSVLERVMLCRQTLGFDF